MKSYPAIEAVVRHGQRLAVVGAVLVAGFSVASYAAGGSLLQLAAGLVAAAATYGVLKVAVELVEVVADTLLPK